jgi:hypothetical protein
LPRAAIIIAADNDDNGVGIDAARSLASRLAAGGYRVRIDMPKNRKTGKRVAMTSRTSSNNNRRRRLRVVTNESPGPIHSETVDAPAAAEANGTEANATEATVVVLEPAAHVLYDLDGEVSKETLARFVFLAMAEASIPDDETSDAGGR